MTRDIELSAGTIEYAEGRVARRHERPCSRVASAEVMHLRQAVDGRVDPDRARLELQGEVEGVVPRLMQVAAVEPQGLLLRRLPHVALLALPGTRVLPSTRPMPPDLPDFVRDLLGDQIGGPAVH